MLPALQTAIDIRNRLRNPPNAVADRPIELRNGHAVTPAVVVNLAPAVEQTENRPPVIPNYGDTRETFLAHGRHLGLAILRGRPARLLHQEGHGGVSMALILTEVAYHFRITVHDIQSPARERRIVMPRMVVAYLARHMTRLTSPQIGKRLGDRDHSTILHAIEKIDALVNSDQEFAASISTIRRRIQESVEA